MFVEVRRFRDKIAFRSAAVFSLLLFLLGSSCAVNTVTGERQIMLVSEAQEVQMGAEYDPQVLATFGSYDAPELLAFIESKGTEMGRISHRPDLQYHFRILDSPVVNAFAVPGGYIYFTRGMLAQLNSQAGLIGILGHEMGHITARHSASQQSQQQLAQLALIGGMIASEEFARYGQLAMQGMGLLFLKFSRDHEREADRLGVEYASKVGFDAHRMADFFQVLNRMNMESSQGGVPTFFSTHPNPEDRYNTVHRLADRWQSDLDRGTWEVNSDEYLRMIDGMVYGEDPRQGYVEGTVFYHPELRFMFSIPRGWELENSPMQVSLAPASGRALVVFTLSNQKSLEAAARETTQQLGLSQQGGKRVTVHGMPALATFARQYPQGASREEILAVLSYYISYNEDIYVFHGVSRENEFNAYQGLLESTMRSFARLSDPAKINVNPERIKIMTVQRTAELETILASAGVPEDRMREVALLNERELGDRIRAGDRIKVVTKN